VFFKGISESDTEITIDANDVTFKDTSAKKEVFEESIK